MHRGTSPERGPPGGCTTWAACCGPTRPGCLEPCVPHRGPLVEWLIKVSGAGDTQTVESVRWGDGGEAGVSVTKCSSPALADTGRGRLGKRRKSQRILVKAFQGFAEPCLWHPQAAHLPRLNPSRWCCGGAEGVFTLLPRQALHPLHRRALLLTPPFLLSRKEGMGSRRCTARAGGRMGSGQGEAAPRTSPAHVFACVTGQESSMKKLINPFGSEAHRHPVYSQLSSHLTPTPTLRSWHEEHICFPAINYVLGNCLFSCFPFWKRERHEAFLAATQVRVGRVDENQSGCPRPGQGLSALAAGPFLLADPGHTGAPGRAGSFTPLPPPPGPHGPSGAPGPAEPMPQRGEGPGWR